MHCTDISDQDGGCWKQQHQHTTFKSSYFLGIIIERVQKQHIMTTWIIFTNFYYIIATYETV